MKLKKMVLYGVILGCFVLLLQYGFGVSEDIIKQYYWIAGGFLIVLICLITLLYSYMYGKKIQAIAPLLDSDPMQYVEKSEQLLREAHMKTVKQALHMNIGAGYMRLQAYEKAYDSFKNVRPKELVGSQMKLVYVVDLCQCMYEIGSTAEANKLCLESEALFQRYEHTEQFGGYISDCKFVLQSKTKTLSRLINYFLLQKNDGQKMCFRRNIQNWKICWIRKRTVSPFCFRGIIR